MPSGICTVCGIRTSGGTRCLRHPRGSGKGNPVHADPRWARLSKRLIARHVGQFGWACPGDGPDHPAHPTRDLTLDHVIPLRLGGAPLDEANLRVLCRSQNSAKGATVASTKPLTERQAIRARYLG
jgi:5-methylcytosine-specific restriction endonuclease McrA